LKNDYLGDREGNGRLTRNWILGKQVARMGSGLKSIRIVSNGRRC